MQLTRMNMRTSVRLVVGAADIVQELCPLSMCNKVLYLYVSIC